MRDLKRRLHFDLEAQGLPEQRGHPGRVWAQEEDLSETEELRQELQGSRTSHDHLHTPGEIHDSIRCPSIKKRNKREQ